MHLVQHNSQTSYFTLRLLHSGYCTLIQYILAAAPASMYLVMDYGISTTLCSNVPPISYLCRCCKGRLIILVQKAIHNIQYNLRKLAMKFTQLYKGSINICKLSIICHFNIIYCNIRCIVKSYTFIVWHPKEHNYIYY